MAGEDAAFLLGAGGSTKRKVARAAGARLELDDDADGKHVLTVSGPDAARARAVDYVRWVLKQRLGAIEVRGASARDDLSIVRVPADCVAYVTGKSGRVLRAVEEEFGTLLFFGKLVGDAGERMAEETERGQTIETLCVLGDRRGRRGAELKVMSAVEHKTPGWYVNDEKKLRARLKQPGDGEGDGFGYDVFPFEDHEFSYALGAQVRFFSFRPFLSRFRFCGFSFVRCGGRFVNRAPDKSAPRTHKKARSLSCRSAELDPARRAITERANRERRWSHWFADVFWLARASPSRARKSPRLSAHASSRVFFRTRPACRKHATTRDTTHPRLTRTSANSL